MALNVFWTVNGKSRQEGEALAFTPVASDLGKKLEADIVVLLPHKYIFEDENGGFQEGTQAYQMHWKSVASSVGLGNLDIATDVRVSSQPKVGEAVQAILGVAPDGVTTTFSWLEGTRLVSQGPSLLVDSSLSGKTIKVIAIFQKNGFATEQIESDSFIVEKGIMEVPQFQIDGFQAVGEELDAWINNEDAQAEYFYQWFRDGVEVPFEVGKFYEVKAQDVGKLLGVRVSVTRQGFEGSFAIVNLTKVIPGPKITKFSTPKIEGKPNVGQTISVNVGTWLSYTKFQFQWFKNGQPIENANSKTLGLRIEDFGRDISVQVTGTKTGFLPKVVESLKVKVLPGTLKTQIPNVLGQVKTGLTLTAQTLPGTPGALISYQWLLDGKPIKNATQQNYTLLKSQKGKSISVVVTQVASGFAKASKTSPSLKIK
jgi:predicted RNA-binding protein with TRAM domain